MCGAGYFRACSDAQARKAHRGHRTAVREFRGVVPVRLRLPPVVRLPDLSLARAFDAHLATVVHSAARFAGLCLYNRATPCLTGAKNGIDSENAKRCSTYNMPAHVPGHGRGLALHLYHRFCNALQGFAIHC
jgi:hypothetical protein